MVLKTVGQVWCQICGFRGGGCQKQTNQSQHMGSQCSGETKLQPPLSTAMFYCHNLNYNILTAYNKEHPPVGTQPQPFRSGPTWPNSTRIQKMLWNRETVQVKLPGFSFWCKGGNKTHIVDFTTSLLPWQLHGNPQEVSSKFPNRS